MVNRCNVILAVEKGEVVDGLVDFFSEVSTTIKWYNFD